MTILDILSKEHALFHKIIARIDAATSRDEPTARLEIERALLVLLPALARHEAIEMEVFKRPSRAEGPETAKIAATIASQHKEILALHRDILEILRLGGKYDFSRLKSLTAELCQKLRGHFYMEESRLWPRRRAALPAARRRAVGQRAGQNVADLEREISRNWDLVSDYVKSA